MRPKKKTKNTSVASEKLLSDVLSLGTTRPPIKIIDLKSSKRNRSAVVSGDGISAAVARFPFYNKVVIVSLRTEPRTSVPGNVSV